MFPFTKWHREAFYWQVIQLIAREMQIEDYGWKSLGELMDQIRSKDGFIGEKMDNFFEAYSELYEFNYDEDGIVREKDEEQIRASRELEDTRDRTRDQLKTALGVN